MLKQIGMVMALLTTFFIGAFGRDSSSNQNTVGHAIIGEVKKVDHTAGKVVVKTAEGTVDTFKFTGKTAGRGLKEGGTGIEEGMRVVVHYTGEGVEKTAVGIEDIGNPKVIEGAVVGTGKGVRTVILKTPAGAGETLHLSERCMVDTGKGIARGSEYTAKKGEYVTVHYTVAGERKVAHLLKRFV